MAYKDNVGVVEELNVELVECAHLPTVEEAVEMLYKLDDDQFSRVVLLMLELLK